MSIDVCRHLGSLETSVWKIKLSVFLSHIVHAVWGVMFFSVLLDHNS